MKKSANRHSKQSKNTFADVFSEFFLSDYQLVSMFAVKSLHFSFGIVRKYALSLHPLYNGMAIGKT